MSKKTKIKKNKERMCDLYNGNTQFGDEGFIDWLEDTAVYLFFWRLWNGYSNEWCGVRYIPKEAKWFFQRALRGYSDDQLWSLDYHLGKHIIKCLKAFKVMKRFGIPGDYTIDAKGKEVPANVAMKNYKKDIQDMIDGFVFMVDDRDEFNKILKKNKNNYKKAIKEYNKKYLEAQNKATKFIQHFGSLWD